MLNHLQQPWIGPEQVLPEIRAAFDEVLLILPVADFAEPLDQKAIAVILNQTVPVRAPDDFNDVPPGTAEDRLEFLNDLAVATYRAVEPLQVAVHDEDQIVELLARSQRDRTERLWLIHLAVTEERP